MIDATLNMVPFIDLLSVLIVFLLMTSVWTQLARIDVKVSQDSPGESADAKPTLAVLITPAGYSVTLRNAQIREIAKRAESYDVTALGEVLAAERALDPSNAQLQVTCDDVVPYEHLIEVMDAALELGLSQIAIAPT